MYEKLQVADLNLSNLRRQRCKCAAQIVLISALCALTTFITAKSLWPSDALHFVTPTVCSTLPLFASSAPFTRPPFESRAGNRTLIVWAHSFNDEVGDENLLFFLAQAIVQDASFYFTVVVNGVADPVWRSRLNRVQAANANFEWRQRPNYGFDFCAWRSVLHPLLKSANASQPFRYFILLNKSVRGPFVPHYFASPWPTIFTSRLSDTVKLSGTSVHCNQNEPPMGMHMQSMVLAFDASLLAEFLNNTGCYDSKEDTINRNEIGFSQHVLRSGFRLASTTTLFGVADGIDANSPLCTWIIERNRLLNPSSPYPEDPSQPGNAAGIDFHPFDMVFYKTSRGYDLTLMHHFTEMMLLTRPWTTPRDTLCRDDD